MKLDKYSFIGPEGNGVVLTVSQTVEGDQVEVTIQRANETRTGFNIQTIRLDQETFNDLCDTKYKSLFFTPRVKEVS